jgi:hypoxanthine-DNA glycosylase
MRLLTHTFPAYFQKDSTILILGSFPSVKSREEGFYYAHPRNRFWPVIAGVYGEKVPVTLTEKKALLDHHHLALYDVVESCLVKGSSDASISQVTLADLSAIKAPIKKIILNGKTAERYFLRHDPPVGIPSVSCPSTSPANCALALETLIRCYGQELLNETR